LRRVGEGCAAIAAAKRSTSRSVTAAIGFSASTGQ
jgi:hypothetical protein